MALWTAVCHDGGMTQEASAAAGRRVELPMAGPQAAVVDTLERPLRDLRISVTDRCNFRCVYCMPKEVFGPGYAFLPRPEILTFEEVERLVRIFSGLGVEKVRLTGGEPLVRQGLEKLVQRLVAVPGVDEVALTTNGSLLDRRARELAEAGLDRVTVSLDAVDQETFAQMNDVKLPLRRVLKGIDAAVAAGLEPVKINMVVRRGWNDGAVLPVAQRFRRTGRIVRFIEYMDVGSSNGWSMEDVVPAAEILEMIGGEHPLEPVEATHRGEVAQRYRYLDGGGEIGIVASVTAPFCGDCNRARLSADGKLFTCLFASNGHDLRGLLRGGASDFEIHGAIASVWSARDDRYSELRSSGVQPSDRRVEMSYIGG
jgi:GTP 3',8-cyclase